MLFATPMAIMGGEPDTIIVQPSVTGLALPALSLDFASAESAPLEPMDNQEFIAQMAQFTSLEQARQTNDKFDGMLTLESATQAISLIGKTVQLAGTESNPIVGEVTTVRFVEGVPKVTFLMDGTAYVDKSLSEIAVIREGSETPVD